MARYSIVKRQKKYYKYQDWSQPINPTGITATSGWTNPANAFDGLVDTYAACGTATDYIEWDLGVNILLSGITATGFFVDSVARACNMTVKAVNERGVETVLGTTTGSASTTTYNLTVTFPETIVNKLRFYLTTSDGGSNPSTSVKTRIREINLTANRQVIESTSSDYDYYVDNNKLYIPARRRREYYKYEDWTQPVLTANGTLGGDSFAVSSSSNYSGWPAWKAFDGVLTGSNGWSASANSYPQHIIFYNPVKILVSNINIMNHVSKDGGFTAGNIYGSDDGFIWVLINSFTNDVITKGVTWDINLSNNKSFYKYHKIEITAGSGFASNNLPKCQEITITAKTSSKSTEADYDYYVDRNVAYDLVYKPFEVISQIFNVSDELQTYVVPEGVSKVNVVCVASRGGNTYGGNGGSVKCALSVTEGQTLYIMVGGTPENYNTASYNASDIRLNGTEYENRIIIAGGGGGGAGATTYGGAGGGLIGGGGGQNGYQKQATGGTQSEGGKHSVASGGSPYELYYGKDGGYALGGNGGSRGGGAGGAGYYGGGGGGAIVLSSVGAKSSGGAGGSSYTDETLCTNVIHLQGINGGEGYVKISYIKELI